MLLCVWAALAGFPLGCSGGEPPAETRPASESGADAARASVPAADTRPVAAVKAAVARQKVLSHPSGTSAPTACTVKLVVGFGRNPSTFVIGADSVMAIRWELADAVDTGWVGAWRFPLPPGQGSRFCKTWTGMDFSEAEKPVLDGPVYHLSWGPEAAQSVTLGVTPGNTQKYPEFFSALGRWQAAATGESDAITAWRLVGRVRASKVVLEMQTLGSRSGTSPGFDSLEGRLRWATEPGDPAFGVPPELNAETPLPQSCRDAWFGAAASGKSGATRKFTCKLPKPVGYAWSVEVSAEPAGWGSGFPPGKRFRWATPLVLMQPE